MSDKPTIDMGMHLYKVISAGDKVVVTLQLERFAHERTDEEKLQIGALTASVGMYFKLTGPVGGEE